MAKFKTKDILYVKDAPASGIYYIEAVSHKYYKGYYLMELEKGISKKLFMNLPITIIDDDPRYTKSLKNTLNRL